MMLKFAGKLFIDMLIVWLALAGCQGQASPASATPTPTQAPPVTVATATIPPVATKTVKTAQIAQILDMSFTDAQDGWLLAASYQAETDTWGIAIRQTNDGGVTWTPVNVPQAQPATSADITSLSPQLVRQIRFLDTQTGWIYGPGLFFTRDGGKGWQVVALEGSVVSLEPAGRGEATWAVTQTCSLTTECALKLYATVPDQPAQWKLVSAIPAQHPLLAFARPDPTTGYALSFASSTSFQINLIATRDAGLSWVSSSTPCASEQPLLAAPDEAHLFLVCAGEPGAGQQLKQFYTSADRGQTWVQLLNPVNDKNIPTAGYTDGIVFLTPKIGLIGLGRGWLVLTRDGGESWMPLAPEDQAGGGWVLVSAGTEEFWAAIQGTIYRSLDAGSTWQSIPIR